MMQKKCVFNCFKVFFENPNFGGSYLEIGKKLMQGGPEVLATNAAACSKEFETFQEPTHVSSPL
jgi:hypothetical protein